MEEIWKDVEGYEGLYQVSNLGRVRSFHGWRGTTWVLSPSLNRKGYLCVAISKNGKMKTVKIHRLVAMAFLPNPLNLPQVNHKDENKTNNVVVPGNPELSNLEWCDSKYNHNYGTRNERASRANRKPVVQRSLDGSIINMFESQVAAAEAIGGNCANISMACNRDRVQTYKGYIWDFA